MQSDTDLYGFMAGFGRRLGGMTGDDPKDKFREARELFERSRETFYEGHKEGMGAFDELTGDELSERVDEAIETERRAIKQAGEAIRLQREAVKERRRELEEMESGEDTQPR